MFCVVLQVCARHPHDRHGVPSVDEPRGCVSVQLAGLPPLFCRHHVRMDVHDFAVRLVC